MHDTTQRQDEGAAIQLGKMPGEAWYADACSPDGMNEELGLYCYGELVAIATDRGEAGLPMVAAALNDRDRLQALNVELVAALGRAVAAIGALLDCPAYNSQSDSASQVAGVEAIGAKAAARAALQRAKGEK